MSRFSKRGRNPGAADFWLESLGYYRKNVAYDETSLFRAVSEQLFATQIKHEEIRKRCITYGKQHSVQFAHLVPKKKDWYERLKKLSIHMVECNELEIQLVCCAYSVEITLFIAKTNDRKEFYPFTRYIGEHKLLLCQMSENHFDAVYPKEHIASAGFCQSVVYDVLYESVFKIPDAEAIAHSMLHDKQTNYVTYSPEAVTAKNEPKDNEADCDNSNLGHTQQSSMLAPFPFKIAKALDPNMYRNIEYDTWIEQRRDLRLGNWYQGDNNLILGTRCLVTINDQDMECYIQTMFEDDPSKCEVYITKLAERLTVNYTDLRPETDAKPWPLPFRFLRGQSVAMAEAPPDNDRKSLRKRREKKRSQYNNEQNNKLETNDAVAEVNVSNYEGYPLLMQDSHKASSSPEQQLSQGVNKDSMECCKEQSNTPVSETVSWIHSSDGRQEAYQNVTTECITYEETRNEVYTCTFTEQGTTYPVMPMWPSSGQYVMTPDSAIGDDAMVMNGKPEASAKYVYFPTDSAYASPTYPSSVSSTPYSVSPFPAAFNNDRMVCSTPVSLAGAPPDMYPVMYPVPAPGTPVYYSPPVSAPPPPLNQHLPEFNVIPTTHPPPYAIYTPPTEMPYMSSGGYVYPATTPPITYYNHPHINSQGFIFPVPGSVHKGA